MIFYYYYYYYLFICFPIKLSLCEFYFFFILFPIVLWGREMSEQLQGPSCRQGLNHEDDLITELVSLEGTSGGHLVHSFCSK